MKIKFFLLNILIFSLHFSYRYFPLSFYIKNPHASYEEVYNHFYHTYFVPATTTITFQKKPDGWNVLSEDNGFKEEAILWSIESKKFKEVKFLKKNKEKVTITNLNKNTLEYYCFNTGLFYGYSDWSKDIILVFENEQNLSDDHLNALARAYANEAAFVLAPYFLFQTRVNKYDDNFDKAVFSKEELNRFIELMYLDINAYERLMNQNPQYNTFVGNVKLKCWDEYTYAYNTLNIIGYEELAEQFLKMDLFDEFFISLSKSMLDACDKNGILFVGGDNDTYPLLYVQEKFNYRKDITPSPQSLPKGTLRHTEVN